MSYSSSTILLPVLLVVSSVVIVTSSRSNSNKLIEEACNTFQPDSSKTNQCVRILASHPNIVSANNFYDMSIEIIQSGMSSVTNTRTHIEKLLRGAAAAGPSSKDALQGCKAAHDGMARTFEVALRDAKDKHFQAANYILLVASTDGFQSCLADVAAGKVKDRTILRDNDLAIIFGLSAFEALCLTESSLSNGKKLF